MTFFMYLIASAIIAQIRLKSFLLKDAVQQSSYQRCTMSFIETVKEIIEIFFPAYLPGELLPLAKEIGKREDEAND